MKPQYDEPCNDCRYWDDETGCSQGHYDSSAMKIFGYCGMAKPKENNKED